jgi:hypothetical protein
MSVTITSPHLPDPVIYSIGFRQTNDTTTRDSISHGPSM